MVERLRSNFCLFKDSIVAQDIMYHLYEKRALNDSDLDVIDSIVSNEQKTIKLLRLLQANKDPTWVFTLRDTLADSDTEFMQSLADILDGENTAL